MYKAVPPRTQSSRVDGSPVCVIFHLIFIVVGERERANEKEGGGRRGERLEIKHERYEKAGSAKVNATTLTL